MFGSKRMSHNPFRYSYVSSPRPLYQRLTILAWLGLFVSVFLIGGGIFLATRWLGTAQPAAVSLPAPAPAATLQAQAMPKYVLKETSVSAQPAQLATAVLAARATAVAPAEVGNVVVLPAPQSLQVATTVKQYYSLIKGMPLPMYLAQRDLLWPTFFAGEALQTIRTMQAEQTTYSHWREGEIVVAVESLSEDRQAATVRVTQKDWLVDTIDIATQKANSVDVRQPDVTLMLQMEYVTLESRWKVTRMQQL